MQVLPSLLASLAGKSAKRRSNAFIVRLIGNYEVR